MKTNAVRIDAVPEENATQTPRRAIDAVVAEVRRDAVVNSQEYLEETKVPHGGE
jgi:hypothetical protein